MDFRGNRTSVISPGHPWPPVDWWVVLLIVLAVTALLLGRLVWMARQARKGDTGLLGSGELEAAKRDLGMHRELREQAKAEPRRQLEAAKALGGKPR